jgi:peptide/nickel transport system permease protein
LAVLALYGPVLAPHDAYFSVALSGGKAPPFPPSANLPFGSDRLGHDIFSWILIGARTTLVIAVAAAGVRLAIGSALGIVSAANGGRLGTILRALALGLNSLPAVLCALLAVLFLHPYTGPGGFVIAFGMVGWADAFFQTRRVVEAETRAVYVTAAVALGADRRRILLRHIFPNIAPTWIVLGFLQVSAVLILLGELGLIRVMVGRPLLDTDVYGAVHVVPSYPEWSAMLAVSRPIIDLYGESWQILAPGLALLVSVLLTGSLGDALARRASRTSIYHLLSRREVAAIGVLAAVLVLPTFFWPSRIEGELARARSSLDTEHVAQLAADLRTIMAPEGSDPARTEAATRALAESLSGASTRLPDERVVGDARIALASNDLQATAFRSLAAFDHRVAGPLFLLDSNPALMARRDISLAGRILAFVRPTDERLPILVNAAAGARAAGVILLTNAIDAYQAGARRFGIPVYAILEPTLSDRLGRSFAASDPNGTRVEDLRVEVSLSTVTRLVPAFGVTARSRERVGDAILVVSSIGDPRRSAYSLASATAALHAARQDALPPWSLLFVAVPHAERAEGLLTATDALSPDARGSLRAIVIVDAHSDERSIEVESPSLQAPNRGTRAGQRFGDALGITVRAHSDPQRATALRQAGLGAPVFKFNGRVARDDALATFSIELLAFLVYLVEHPDELVP